MKVGGPEIALISICINEEHWAVYLELYLTTGSLNVKPDTESKL